MSGAGVPGPAREPSETIDPIFVLGTGRSGTHLVGHVLASFPEVRVTIERPPMFEWSTKIALDANRRSDLLPRLLEWYREEVRASRPLRYADKSHPNLWLTEDLAEAFPAARFIGVHRQPFATVASMLEHGGVLEWHDRWREFPVPNPFLGITKEIALTYDDLSLPAKCALRWRAHHDRSRRLRHEFGADRFHVLHYEQLVRQPEQEIHRLSHFLDLPAPSDPPRIRRDSLERWRERLSDEQIAEIEGVAGHP